MSAKVIQFSAKLLQTSNGKDKVMRTISYASALMSTLQRFPVPLRKSLLILADQLSKARTINRLFDDLPMLNYSLHCGNESFLVWINNVLDQIYYPVEHLEWANQVGMIKFPWFVSDPLVPGQLTVPLWTASLVLNLAQSLRLIASQKKTLRHEFPNLLRAGCDLINAIHWWPWKKPLLTDFQSSLLGIISSVILLKQAMVNC